MNKIIKIVLSTLLFSCFLSNTAYAGYGAGVYFGHNRPYPPAYGWGGFYGGGWFPGPNIIINVPAQRYYPAPPCETIRICDESIGECWLEKRCG